MARWIVFGEVELGRLDGPRTKQDAEGEARRRFGVAAVRVQSLVSYEAGLGELSESDDDD